MTVGASGKASCRRTKKLCGGNRLDLDIMRILCRLFVMPAREAGSATEALHAGYTLAFLVASGFVLTALLITAFAWRTPLSVRLVEAPTATG
ncbi:MAG: hypothetical protein SYR96_25775 [Actinomycetota bacterium]|nr:hypothetical protein [Actinomycetota bacterium]